MRRLLISTLFPYTTLFRSFAGNFARRTQTMSLAIMAALETDLSAALALAVLLVGIAAAVLILSRVVAGRWLDQRSEEHTSELQSLRHLVCRLLLEKKKKPQ